MLQAALAQHSPSSEAASRVNFESQLGASGAVGKVFAGADGLQPASEGAMPPSAAYGETGDLHEALCCPITHVRPLPSWCSPVVVHVFRCLDRAFMLPTCRA